MYSLNRVRPDDWLLVSWRIQTHGYAIIENVGRFPHIQANERARRDAVMCETRPGEIGNYFIPTGLYVPQND
jgi:hypothetical protein